MKRIHLAGLTLSVTLILLFAASVLAGNSSEKKDDPRLITVQGNAKLMVPPDKAVITLELESRRDDLDDAKEHVDSLTTALFDLADMMEIPRAQVHTSQYSIFPAHEKRKKHIVRTCVSVTITDLEKVNPFLEQAVEAGIDEIPGVSFEMDNPLESRIEVHRQAAEAARQKAEVLAETLGTSLGRVHRITELPVNPTPFDPWQMKRYSSPLNSVVGVESMAFEEAGESQISVAAGEIEVQGRVEVVFELGS